MVNKWDERFASEDFFYGEKPNVFFEDFLKSLPNKGTLLLPAEGEGRNAVFAASQGWAVSAFDSSKVARQKALDFAKSKNVQINYYILDLASFVPEPEKYDLAALIFAHMPEGMRKSFHAKIMESLKPGGFVLVESFAKEQINNNSGGPPDFRMLYSTEILKEDFSELKTIKLCQERTTLNEGHHTGVADVVRFIGQKI